MNNQEMRKELFTLLSELRKNGFDNDELKRKYKYISCIEDNGDSIIAHIDEEDEDYGVLPVTVIINLLNCAESYGYNKDDLGIVFRGSDHDCDCYASYLLVKYKVKVSDKEYLSYVSKLYTDWKLSNRQSSVVEKLSSLLGCRVNPSHIDSIKDILKDL